MTNPLASEGWYVLFDKVPSTRCSEESQVAGRKYCPVALPCEPSTACRGSNYCDPQYEGERCSICSAGSIRVNGRCESRLVLYLAITLLTLVSIVFMLSLWLSFIGRQHRRNQHILRYNYEFLDVLQTIGAYSKFHIYTGYEFSNRLYSASTVLFDPADFLHGGDFVQSFILIQLLPLILASLILLAYLVEFLIVFRWTIKQTRVFCAEPGMSLNTLSEASVSVEPEAQPTNYWKISKHVLAALRGKYFYYVLKASFLTFVPVINNGLSVFNCNVTNPSDGSRYLQSIGTNEKGICYINGSVQQGLVIFSAVTTILYAIFIPLLLIGHCVMHDCCQTSIDDCEIRTETSSVDILMRSIDSQKPDSKFCACPTSHCTVIIGQRYWMSDAIIKKMLLCGTVFVWRKDPEIALTICAAIEICRLAQVVVCKPYSSRVTSYTLLSKILGYFTSYDVFVLSDLNVARAVLTISLVFLCLGYISLSVNHSSSTYGLITATISVSLVYFLAAIVELPIRSSTRLVVVSLSHPDEAPSSAPPSDYHSKLLDEEFLSLEKPCVHKMNEIIPDDDVRDFNPVVPEAQFNLKSKQLVGKVKVHKISRKPTATDSKFLEERQASSDSEIVLQRSDSMMARKKKYVLQDLIEEIKEKKKISPLTQKITLDDKSLDFNEQNPLRTHLKSTREIKSAVKIFDTEICDTPDPKLSPEKSTSLMEDIAIVEKPAIISSRSKRERQDRHLGRHAVDSLNSLSYLIDGDDAANLAPSTIRPAAMPLSPYALPGISSASDECTTVLPRPSTRSRRMRNINSPSRISEDVEEKADVLADNAIEYMSLVSAKPTAVVSMTSAAPSTVADQPSFPIPAPLNKGSSYEANTKKRISATAHSVLFYDEEKDDSEPENAHNAGSKTRIERLEKTVYHPGPQPAWTVDRVNEAEMKANDPFPVKNKGTTSSHTSVLAFESTNTPSYKPIPSEPPKHSTAKAPVSFKNSVACFLGTAAAAPEVSTGAALGFMKSGTTPPPTPVDKSPIFMRLIRRVSFKKNNHSSQPPAVAEEAGRARVQKVKLKSRNVNKTDSNGASKVRSTSKEENEAFESGISYHLVRSIWTPSFGEVKKDEVSTTSKTRRHSSVIMDSVTKSPAAVAIEASRAHRPSVVERLDTYEEEQVSEGEADQPDRPKMTKMLHETGFRHSLSIIPDRTREFNWNQVPIMMAHEPPPRPASDDHNNFKI